MLRFLLDEHISPTVARELSKRVPEIKVTALQSWRDGELMGAEDHVLLEEASKDGLTFVSYDQKTIRPLLKHWMEAGVKHSGVVFVDEESIKPNDFGGLVKALGALWKHEKTASWKNRIVFLKSTS